MHVHLLNHKKPSILQRNFFLIALAQKIKIAKSTRNYNGTNIVSVRDTNWLKSLIQIRRIKHKFDTNSIGDLFHHMHFSGSWNRRDSHSRNCPLTLIKAYMNSWPFLISFRLILQISTWLLSIFLIKNPNRILVSLVLSSELSVILDDVAAFLEIVKLSASILETNGDISWIWNIWNRYNNKG